MPWSFGPAVCQDAPDHVLGGGIYFDHARSNIHLVYWMLSFLIGRCGICEQSNDQHLLVLCDICKKYYHMGCLDPPLTRLPKKSAFSVWWVHLQTLPYSLVYDELLFLNSSKEMLSFIAQHSYLIVITSFLLFLKPLVNIVLGRVKKFLHWSAWWLFKNVHIDEKKNQPSMQT